jgi:hypothetical protein
VLARVEAQEKERQALEDRTLDQVRPGEQQPEIDHALLGEDMDTGMHLGRRWRDAGRWLAYRFEAPRGGGPIELMLTFFGGDRNDGFRLLVNERIVATISLDAARPDEFIDLTFPIPSHALSEASGGITIKLTAGAKRTGRLFGARLMKAKPPR